MTEKKYTEDSVISLNPEEHIRLRPGMYIGKLGNGNSQDDGIYVLLKEIIDNSIDEFVMGHGKRIEISIKEDEVSVRDYGRGIPLGSLKDCVSKINTGAKYNSDVFVKSVGLNGVGTKAVNALSEYFVAKSIRDGKEKEVIFSKGKMLEDKKAVKSEEKQGTIMTFVPDKEMFGNFQYVEEYVDKMLWNYAYLNKGLTLKFQNKIFHSKKGLHDLLQSKIDENILYPMIHLGEGDFEFVFTHASKQYNEEYYSFVNGQNTTQGGTHLNAFREVFIKTIREYYQKDFDASDIKTSLLAAISIKVQEPVFESQTKTKLGSIHIEVGGQTVKNYISDIVGKYLDNYLHQNQGVAEVILQKILQSEKERKQMAGIKKLARESAKKVSLHNKKLRDCKIHYNDTKGDKRLDTTLFITEGDSASGSITKSRDVQTQAVFSLKGKPLNSYGMSKKIVYQNEEFNLLQAALNIEEGIENLRYNNIVIATDADVDGMHIRLLLLTFFLQFYPDIVKAGHVYILQTPLFRVRNKQNTRYCYSEEERQKALKELKNNPEITRFKGLGEISPSEFKYFIGKDIRLDPVLISKDTSIENVLSYYMGKNTPERQKFIIENLRVEKDIKNE